MSEPLSPAAASSDDELRYRAVLALDGRDPAALPGLVAHLADPSWRVRSAALDAIVLADALAAVDALVPALGAEADPNARGAAAEALVRLGAAALPPLLASLSAGSPELRTAAAEILGDLGDLAAVPGLARQLLEGDGNGRSAAAEALGKIGGPAALERLTLALDGGDETLAAAALAALERLRAPPSAATLERLAQRPALLRPALRAAAFSDEPRALELLVRALESPSRATREVALLSLGTARLRPDAPAAALEEAARRAASERLARETAAGALEGEELGLRAGALMLLRWSAEARHAPALAAAGADEALRALAAEALTASGSEGAQALAGTAGDLAPAARALALEHLARHGHLGAVAELVSAATAPDGSERSRVEALAALGRVGQGGAIGPLAACLDHPDAAVLGSAVAALAELAAASARSGAEVLSAARAVDPPAVGGYRLVGRLGGPEDLPALRDGLRSPRAGLRVEAARALSGLAARCAVEPQAVTGLLHALGDPDAAVRASAAQAVGVVAGKGRGWPEGRRALAERLEDGEPLVAAAAALALGACGASEHARALAAVAGDVEAQAPAAAAAVHALAALGMAELSVLARAARHPDPEVVKEVVLAAAAKREPAATELLLEAARHPRWDVRRTAARTLGARGDGALLGPLRRLAAAELDPLASEALRQAIRALEARL